MSASLPPRHRPAHRLGAAVVRISCPECGRELASATYGVRALLDLHEPTCEARPAAGGGDAEVEAVTPAAD
ncbi:MAG TPA: hypothetical protein VFW24_04760 [Acidimicrobiales bacterium]|nr:hypothetical protein [Acidimicrobiales bacterium]